jgi:thioredoxin-like negative regulator of GroEL
MSKQKRAGANIKALMDTFKSENGANRQKARKALVTLGRPAVPLLTQALQNSRLDQVRWEAAKTLGAIGDARAIPALVKALEDSDPDVAWLAAEALKQFKKEAWPLLFRLLIRSGSESYILRQGAHHVLRNQRENGFNDLLAILRKDLESNTLQESTPLAAYDILRRMKAIV